MTKRCPNCDTEVKLAPFVLESRKCPECGAEVSFTLADRPWWTTALYISCFFVLIFCIVCTISFKECFGYRNYGSWVTMYLILWAALFLAAIGVLAVAYHFLNRTPTKEIPQSGNNDANWAVVAKRERKQVIVSLLILAGVVAGVFALAGLVDAQFQRALHEYYMQKHAVAWQMVLSL